VPGVLLVLVDVMNKNKYFNVLTKSPKKKKNLYPNRHLKALNEDLREGVSGSRMPSYLLAHDFSSNWKTAAS
jgi:hypothetical protein